MTEQAQPIHMERTRKTAISVLQPSYPSVEELKCKAAEVFVLCVKLVSVENFWRNKIDQRPPGISACVIPGSHNYWRASWMRKRKNENRQKVGHCIDHDPVDPYSRGLWIWCTLILADHFLPGSSGEWF